MMNKDEYGKLTPAEIADQKLQMQNIIDKLEAEGRHVEMVHIITAHDCDTCSVVECPGRDYKKEHDIGYVPDPVLEALDAISGFIDDLENKGFVGMAMTSDGRLEPITREEAMQLEAEGVAKGKEISSMEILQHITDQTLPDDALPLTVIPNKPDFEA